MKLISTLDLCFKISIRDMAFDRKMLQAGQVHFVSSKTFTQYRSHLYRQNYLKLIHKLH